MTAEAHRNARNRFSTLGPPEHGATPSAVPASFSEVLSRL